ncbi:hypothetical protein [Ruminococcus sp.]|uniref:hypothetical protein n=1 Tax=Ruminococcus sp. TaxID=41978 RepID=UPI0025F44BE0|nr:hypothetical protein [Ruminococcus sp.]
MKAYMMKAYLTVMNKIASLKDNEDGMETVQAIILVVVGLVIVVALITIIGKDENSGLFSVIKQKLSDIGININGK